MRRPEFTASEMMAYTQPRTVEEECLACIQWCHMRLPENASYSERVSKLDANAPHHWGRRDFGWRTWLRCRKAYLVMLWPGRPAPELTPEAAPLFFWRGGGVTA